MNPHKRKRVSAKKRKRLASAANPPVGGMLITTEEEHMRALGMIERNEARRRASRTTVVEDLR